MAKNKMTKDTVPEGFTLGLAAVDALPVILFGAAMLSAGLLIKSGLFILGAALCLFAGGAKVVWKFIVVLKRKNVWWLFMQMRTLMPVGMLLMLAGLIIAGVKADMNSALESLIAMPQGAFFAVGILGMILMGVFAAKLDSADAKSNWIEQLTNAAAQACFLAGILCMLLK